jgi:hypothetical protein
LRLQSRDGYNGFGKTPVIPSKGGHVQEHLKMYDEDLVKEIMISTALCVQELLMDDPQARQDDVFDFVESNFKHIITETLRAEREREPAENGESPGMEDPGFPEEL